MPDRIVYCSKDQCEAEFGEEFEHDCNHDDCYRIVHVSYDDSNCILCRLQRSSCHHECNRVDDPMPEVDLGGDCDRCLTVHCEAGTEPEYQLCKKTPTERGELLAEWNEGYRYMTGG